MQADLLCALNEIEDPELGIGIVDLGLVYRAEWTEKGIDVELTITSPSCPFGEVLRAQAEDGLRQRFAEASSISVRLVRDPPWTADRITESARQKLGWSRPPEASKGNAGHSPAGVFGFWKH